MFNQCKPCNQWLHSNSVVSAFMCVSGCGLIRSKWQKVTLQDTKLTSHLASHRFMLPQSPIRAWLSCPTHCTFQCSIVVFVVPFFFSTLSGSLTLSLTHCKRIDSQSTLTKLKGAAHFCPHWAQRAYNQAKRQVAKAQERRKNSSYQ